MCVCARTRARPRARVHQHDVAPAALSGPGAGPAQRVQLRLNGGERQLQRRAAGRSADGAEHRPPRIRTVTAADPRPRARRPQGPRPVNTAMQVMPVVLFALKVLMHKMLAQGAVTNV